MEKGGNDRWKWIKNLSFADVIERNGENKSLQDNWEFDIYVEEIYL